VIMIKPAMICQDENVVPAGKLPSKRPRS
jgi:hypothetical protein